MKNCVLCQFPRCRDSKYCSHHFNQAILEMRRSNYLTQVPRTVCRPTSARENTYETKFGRAS